jgi:ribonuclease P protein component
LLQYAHVENLSTKEEEACQSPWSDRAQAHPGWQECFAPPQSQRPPQAHPVIGNFMPAKQFRLPAEALKDSRGFARRSSPLFMVRFKPNGLSNCRFAVVVSAKVDKTSAGRHLLKRIASEYLRQRSGNWDMIITVLSPAKTLTRKAFLQELDRLLP